MAWGGKECQPPTYYIVTSIWLFGDFYDTSSDTNKHPERKSGLVKSYSDFASFQKEIIISLSAL